jgi:hypothetical protein
MVTKNRTLFMWLTKKLGLCSDRSRLFSQLTPEEAWMRATMDDRYEVMYAFGMIKADHENFENKRKICPICNPDASANKKIPARMLNAFRRWQRTGK